MKITEFSQKGPNTLPKEVSGTNFLENTDVREEYFPEVKKGLSLKGFTECLMFNVSINNI